MCAKHDGSGEMAAFLVCQVGDILFAGADDELLVTEKVLRTFRDGGIGKLAHQTHIIFAGSMLDLPADRRWGILLSQSHYAKDLQKVTSRNSHSKEKSPTRINYERHSVKYLAH